MAERGEAGFFFIELRFDTTMFRPYFSEIFMPLIFISTYSGTGIIFSLNSKNTNTDKRS